jgi:hypothetical protein
MPNEYFCQEIFSLGQIASEVLIHLRCFASPDKGFAAAAKYPFRREGWTVKRKHIRYAK